MGDSPEEIYADVLRKHHGDHRRAQQAFQELGLPLPAQAPRLDSTASSSHPPGHQEVIPVNGNAPRASPQSSEHNPSPGFLCPLTGIIMRDPVVLNATLISYEREAIQWWLQVYPGRCPVTGRPVEEDPSLSPDDELRAAITNWAARYAPHLMDTQSGALLPAAFPDGIESAITHHQAASSAPSAPPAHPAPSRARNGSNGTNGGQTRPPGYPYRPDLPSAATPLYGGGCHAEQLRTDRELAMKIAHESASPGDPYPEAVVALAPRHTLVMANRLERARARGASSYPFVSPFFFFVLLGGFLFSLSKNDWNLEGSSTNPWIGIGSDAMRAGGAACSACVIRGEWWRILSALLIPAGVIHLVAVSFLISASSSVCSRAGLPPGEFVSCILIGGVIGSMTSAVAAPHTIHSASGGLGAAAASAALAAVLSVRQHVVTYVMPLFLASLWLVTMLVSCLAPFVDTWASLAGGLAGGLCAGAFMAPYASKQGSRSAERLVIAWQVTLTALLVAAAVSVLASVLSMPRTGYDCGICDEVTCQSLLGWRCAAAANRQGFCEIRVFPDNSAVIVCPSREEIQIDAVNGNFALLDVDAECDARCGAGAPPAPPAAAVSPPSSGGSGAGAAEPTPGSFQPIDPLFAPLPAPDDSGDGGGGIDDDAAGGDPDAQDGADADTPPSGGGSQFIDPTAVGGGAGRDDVGATSR
eukprot:jgi/Ulvmu1/3795/UM018_0005.1